MKKPILQKKGRPVGALGHIDHQNRQARQVPPIHGLLLLGLGPR